MAPRPGVLADTPWKTVRESPYEVAVLPWGATEAHNLHLPYGTDTLQAERVAHEAARIALEGGARVVVLPAVPFGVHTGQLDVKLCLNMNPGTQAQLLADLADSLVRAGVRKLAILNGHGGNDFRQMIRQLQPATGLFLCSLNWYACVDPRAFFTVPGDHAGELETSMLLYLAPQLVLPLSDAGEGRARTYRVRGLREGWAWAPRQWTQVTDDTGVGDPRGATAQKGELYFRAVTKQIGEFLVELSDSDPEKMYE